MSAGCTYVCYSPQRCHGDDGCTRKKPGCCELAGAGALLGVEHDRGEDDDGHGEGEEEEAQLWGAALQGIAQDPKALRVTGELEDTKHPEHAQRHEGAAHVLVVGHHQADVVRQDGHHVDDAHHRAHEVVTARRGKQAQQVLHCEYHNAGGVHAKERHGVALSTRHVFLVGGGTTGHRLHHVGEDWDGNEKPGDIVEDQGHGGGVWVLKGSPHGLPEVHVWQLLVLVLLLVILQPL